jgi:hypothetical protein
VGRGDRQLDGRGGVVLRLLGLVPVRLKHAQDEPAGTALRSPVAAVSSGHTHAEPSEADLPGPAEPASCGHNPRRTGSGHPSEAGRGSPPWTDQAPTYSLS